MVSHPAPAPAAEWVDEEKGYRNFGGRPSVPLPVRDIPANMRVTAKQIRYKEVNEKKSTALIDFYR